MMKKSTANPVSGFRRILIILTSLLAIAFPQSPAFAAPPNEIAGPIAASAMKLVSFCANPKSGLDAQAIAALVDYVLEPKPKKESELPQIQEAAGAYYEFDTRISFSNFLQYAYNSKIPAALASPSSLRYSIWSTPPGESQKMPSDWKFPAPGGKPLIIHGLQRDGITPDLTTGVYYEYDLKRILILLNHKGRPVLISISKQNNISDIGKKGFILGNDEDWNYYYSGIPGSAKTGLGWVKAYIYDYFSVGVFVESGTTPAVVRSGFFQWLRAGWSGINFVQPSHIIKGMKRNARNSKTILESPKLPAPNQIASTYQSLADLPSNNLIEKYATLQQARQSLAVQNGKISNDEIKKQDSYANTPKEQIITELMLEYLKVALGKASFLGTKTVLGIK
jgi:hypothetical protein